MLRVHFTEELLIFLLGIDHAFREQMCFGINKANNPHQDKFVLSVLGLSKSDSHGEISSTLLLALPALHCFRWLDR